MLRVDLSAKGGGIKVDLFAPPNAFPVEPIFLNDVAVDPESGMVFVSDSGDGREAAGPSTASPRRGW